VQSRSRETIDKQWSVCTRPFTQCARLQYMYTPTVGAHLRSLCMRALPHFGLGILAIPCDTVRGYVCETCRSCRSCRSCRTTVGPLSDMPLSDCRTTVGITVGSLSELSVCDYAPVLSDLLSDLLSDCRTVGLLSDCCRTAGLNRTVGSV
jgi:hypothetical protein